MSLVVLLWPACGPPRRVIEDATAANYSVAEIAYVQVELPAGAVPPRFVALVVKATWWPSAEIEGLLL